VSNGTLVALSAIRLQANAVQLKDGCESCWKPCHPSRYSGVREVTPEDEADMAAFPINEEADLKSVGAKGPFGEKVQLRECYRGGPHLCVVT
jgi:hypothetical protein